MNAIKIQFIFYLFLLSILSLLKCSKEKNVSPPLPPIELSPYHIMGYVNGNLVDAGYTYRYPDTIRSVYDDEHFYINRITDPVNSQYQGWSLSSNINLSHTSFPITIWPSKVPNNFSNFIYIPN